MAETTPDTIYGPVSDSQVARDLALAHLVEMAVARGFDRDSEVPQAQWDSFADVRGARSTTPRPVALGTAVTINATRAHQINPQSSRPSPNYLPVA